MRNPRLRFLGALMVGVLALTAAACGDDDDDAATTEGTAESTDEGTANESGGSVTIGYIPWDEDIAVTYLWQHVLEENGLDVTLEQLDVATGRGERRGGKGCVSTGSSRRSTKHEKQK